MKKQYVKDFRDILKAFPTLKKWEINQLKKRYREGIKEFKIKGLIYTNDPVKMLGCGTAAHSSYSPSAPFYKHLPSLVLQDYVYMAYYTDGTVSEWTRNNVLFSCPYYITRSFVIKKDRDMYYIGFYGQYHLSVPHDQPTLIIKADCPPPTIHLDDGLLCKRDDDKEGHIAIFATRIPSQDQDCFRQWEKEMWGSYNV